MNKQSFVWEMILSDNLVGTRISQKELESQLSAFIEKEIEFEESSNEDNINLDYELLCGFDYKDNYYYINIYYLKTRNGDLYITEVSVDNE